MVYVLHYYFCASINEIKATELYFLMHITKLLDMIIDAIPYLIVTLKSKLFDTLCITPRLDSSIIFESLEFTQSNVNNFH